MSMPDDALRRIDAVLEVAARLAAATPTGRIVWAKIVAAIDPELVPEPARERFRAEAADAIAATATPLPFSTVKSVLAESWEVDPAAELESLDPEPAAVTPTSQVH